MARKKRVVPATLEETRGCLYRSVGNAPRPLPPGRFPLLMRQAEAEGCPHEYVMDVLDEWLNYGYCRLRDPIAQDIEITDAGRLFFY
ncbi:MAG: hypothetical protein J1E80_00800 [Desulfovibrionaceae bacterium]|nr:hypothetical protein [Desulfovibrionaceae bacterium]